MMGMLPLRLQRALDLLTKPRVEGSDGDVRLSGVVDLDLDMSYERVLSVTPDCVVRLNGYRLYLKNTHESDMIGLGAAIARGLNPEVPTRLYRYERDGRRVALVAIDVVGTKTVTNNFRFTGDPRTGRQRTRARWRRKGRGW